MKLQKTIRSRYTSINFEIHIAKKHECTHLTLCIYITIYIYLYVLRDGFNAMNNESTYFFPEIKKQYV